MNNNFEKELKEAGAKDFEIKELLEIKEKLQDFSNLKVSKKIKNRVWGIITESKEPEKRNVFRWAFIPLITILVLFFFGATIVSAQKSQPGEVLYPVKLVSEEVFQKVKPEFKDEIIVRRSEEVKKLAEEKKDAKLIKKTLKEYKKEILKREERSEEKIRESRKNIEEIKEKIKEEEKKEIEEIFKELENKRESIKEKFKKIEVEED